MFSDNLIKKLIIFFVLLHILIIWWFPYLALNDYLNNLGMVHIINQIIHGNTFLSDLFTFDFLKPTSLPYIIILFFNQFFSITTSGKIFLTLYIVLFSYSMYIFYSTFNKPNYLYATLISTVLIFSHFFYYGLIGFMFSVPLYFIFLSRFYVTKNPLEFSLFLLILYFAHPYSLLYLLISLVILIPDMLKNTKFYLSLIPSCILFIYSFSGSHFSSDIPGFLNYFFSHFSLNSMLLDLLYDLPTFFVFSPIMLIISFLLFLSVKNSKNSNFKISKNVFSLFIFLFIFFILAPDGFSGLRLYVFDTRFLIFLFPFFGLFFKKFDKKDETFILPIIVFFLVLYILLSFYMFSLENTAITDVIIGEEFILNNSSIMSFPTNYVSSSSQIHGITTLSWIHNYNSFSKKGVYSEGLFDLWFNPVNSKKTYDSVWVLYLDYIVFNQDSESLYTCEFYNGFAVNINSSIQYPTSDYIIFYDDQCNSSAFFINDYSLVFEEGKTKILELKKPD